MREMPAFRRHIGVIFQDFRLLTGKTAYENIAFALEVAGQPQSEIDDLVPQALDMVGLDQKAAIFPTSFPEGKTAGGDSAGDDSPSRRHYRRRTDGKS